MGKEWWKGKAARVNRKVSSDDDSEWQAVTMTAHSSGDETHQPWDGILSAGSTRKHKNC